MSESMIDRVARATREAVGQDRGRSVSFEEMSFIVARAAIEAMGNPTDAMVRAGQIPTREIELGNGTTAVGLGLGAEPRTLFRRMIDAALAEERG